MFKNMGIRVLAVLHVACPLLFFTNLTRNPYYTQIALLNILIVLCGLLWALDAFKTGVWKLPRFSFEKPLLGFLVVAFVSTVVSWITHGPLRPGIMFEGARVWAFTLVNSVMALYLPALFVQPVGENPRQPSIWADIVMALLWGGLWFGFHSMRDPNPQVILWDTYGAFLWALAILYSLWRVRHAEAIEFLHLIFVVSMIAGIYGVMQYAGRDIIWTTPIQPYGGRPVSTFGNPNFLSSHLMLVSPLALGVALSASGKQRWGYVLVSAVCAMGVLVTLTRSTYLGLLASYAAMGLFFIKRENLRILKPVGIAIGVLILFILIFPHTPVSNVQSPLARFTEIFDALKSGEIYAPWHQRLLIWSSAWDMLKQNLWLGMGWGAFELFYPFFQGKYLLTEWFPSLRTHANNAHNVLLELWSQVGFLGTGMALWLFTTILVSGYHIVQNHTKGWGRMISAGIWGGIVGMAVDNFFGNVSLFFAVPAFLFWWLVGTLAHEGRTHHITTRPVSNAIGRPVLIVLMVLMSLGGIYYGRRWMQEIYYFEGFKESKGSDIVKSYKALEKAYAWFPGEVNSNYEMGNSYSRTAKMLAERGLPDESRKFIEKARDAYAAALHANPGYDEIYFNHGITLVQLGKQQEATRLLEIALFINPLLRDCYVSLGNLYVTMAGQLPPKEGKELLHQAIRVYSWGTEVFPEDKDMWNNLGYCYSQLGENEKSFQSYKSALMVDPMFNQAWQNIALSLRSLGRQDPIMDVPQHIHQMESALSRQAYAEALAPAKKIVAAMPRNADAHLSVANIHFYLGQQKEAEEAYLAAVKIRPSFVIAYSNLGKLYQTQGKFELARKQFKKALSLSPDDAETKKALQELPK